ncbi:MAG: C25 family cysteine peptidase [Ignavibacteria bacterium]
MKPSYYRTIILLLFLYSGVSSAQNYNWITPNTDYLKIYIIEDGIYRINKQDFLNSGINANNIDPRTIKLFFKGVQIPIYFYGESDGMFNDTDYFDFYAQRNYGGLTNTYKEVNGQLTVDYVTNEFYDLYSDTAVYWVGWGGPYGLRYSDYSFSTNIYYPLDYYLTSRHFEQETIYFMGERLSPYDYRYFNTEKIRGEGWYWRQLQRGNSISDTISMPFLCTTVDSCSLKIFAYPNSYSDTIVNEHILIIKVNNTPFDTLYRDNFNRFDTTIYVPVNLFNTTSQNQISFTYTNPYGYAGYLLFDNFELKFPRRFAIENKRLFFQTNFIDTITRKFAVRGVDTQKRLYIYDVKNYYRITNGTISNDTVYFSGKVDGKYAIYNTDSLIRPLHIKRKQVPNLMSSSNQAEYLIVYNQLFENAAEQLRTFRATHDSLISFKAEVEDIYDIFNFGLEHPIAVRRFVKYVYDTWSPPKIKFLCLLGRGSINPKGIGGTNTYYQNYVPVYGNPISDGYFATTDLTSFLYSPQISVGRIPVYTITEAQNAINKILEYETLQPVSWQKLFTFITGGFTRSDQIQFAIQSDNLINTYIFPPPISGNSTKIYRNDSSGYITYNYQDSIKNSINRGCLFVNYIGHASSSNWDNGLEDPAILSNFSRYPLILSMTCFTGKTAEGQRSFGENFFLLPGKGAIGFVGTSGWSFQGSGNTYNSYIIKGFALDSIRRIGELIKYAATSMKHDSVISTVRNTINSYNLIGDPASKLLLPIYPEYYIQPGDYKLSNLYPSLRENITLIIYPKNLGAFADSCKIRFLLLKNNINSHYQDTVVRSWKYIDTIAYTFSIDSLGQYAMKVILDVDNWNQHEYKLNNSVLIPIYLKNISFVPIKPFKSSVVTSDSVRIVGINPFKSSSVNSIKLIMQIDTTKTFNSSALQTYYMLNPTGLTTHFNINIPYRDTNIVYYWRLNSIINNSDTSGWSQVMDFVYRNTNFSRKRSYENDSLIEILKKFPGQYEGVQFYNTFFENGNIKLGSFIGNLVAQSWGGDYWEASFFRVNNKEYFLLDPILNWGGLNLAKVRKNDGILTEVRHFKFTSPLSSDSVITYLNTFSPNHILMLVKSVPTGVTDQMSVPLKNRFKSMGSYYADSVNLQSWQRWSFITYPTDTGYVKAEVFLSGSNFLPATAVLQPVFNYDSGFTAITLGPSSRWNELKWNFIVYPQSSLSTDIWGITRSSQEILLFSNNRSGFINGFDTVSPVIFPNVKAFFNFKLDSLNGFNSPLLKSISAKIMPPAELIPDPSTFNASDSLVEEGDTVRFSIRYYNIGFTNNYSSIAKWSINYYLGNRTFQIDSIKRTLSVDSSIQISALLNTSRLRNPSKAKDTILVVFEVNTGDNENELFTYNNNLVTRIIVLGDTTKPVMEITYDGVKVIDGDFIQRFPNITLKFYDNGKMVVKDTSNIKVKLDGKYVPYYLNGLPNPELQLILPTNNLQATVVYKPRLSDGEHRFDYIAFDNSGNYADSISHLLVVNPNLAIVSLYNFPNPVKNSTTFIFNIAGGSTPNSCKLKIFTVAGRVIKTLDILANIGINQVFWDGRDNDGDYVANGVYFYKLIVDGETKRESSLQKLVILK